MTDLNKYVEDAIRTESRINEVTIDPNLLFGVLETFIAVGNILDMIKKNVFYEKEIDLDTLGDWWAKAEKGLYQIPVHQEEFSENITFAGDENTRIFHAIVGIATESTELLEALLKYIQGGDLDFVNVCEELGDVNWYQAIAVDTMEANFEKILNVNIDKLRARFPEKFTGENAIERDLNTERQILEDGNETI